MTKRVKIPHKTEVKILMINKHQCCICRELRSSSEIQIHHIDGEPSNNRLENLAVLCGYHHDLANMGLKNGVLGQAKKLTPDEVKVNKEYWEKRVEEEIKIAKKYIPIQERRQLEILYKFEISKRKNEILSLPRKRQVDRKCHYEFLQELVFEEYIGGLKLRPIILEAFNDIALQSLNQDFIFLPLIDAISGLFLHLVGPEYVKISSNDKKLLLRSLDPLETIGGFEAEFSDNVKSLGKVCNKIYELSEIASWYKFREFLNKAKSTLDSIKKDCSQYKPPRGTKGDEEKLIKEKIKLVEETTQSIERLK